MQDAVLVVDADVAGMEPAVAEDLGVGVGPVPVALEQRGRADADLALLAEGFERTRLEVADLELRARHGKADEDRLRVEVEIVGIEAVIHRVAGVGLGHAPGDLADGRASDLPPAPAQVRIELLHEGDAAGALEAREVVAGPVRMVEDLHGPSTRKLAWVTL